jgi:hypothetical protein
MSFVVYINTEFLKTWVLFFFFLMLSTLVKLEKLNFRINFTFFFHPVVYESKGSYARSPEKSLEFHLCPFPPFILLP